MGYHYLDDRNYLEPPEYPDPLESVEFPRERKPWKRDRDTIRWAMQSAINARCAANPMVVDSRGNPGSRSKDHSLRFRELDRLHSEINRFRWEKVGNRRSWRLNVMAGIMRGFDLVPYFDKPRLP